MSDLQKILADLNACPEAAEWVGDKDAGEAWTTCERGDWMLWLATEVNIDRKLIVLAACDCAEPALKYATSDAPRIAIETARAWCRDEATIEQVKDAASAAAYAAAYAAYSKASHNAAVHAAHAVYAAYAAHAAARAESLKHSADLVRQRIPLEVIADRLKR